MAYVGGEASLALDPLLELVHHAVERAGQTLQVGVGRVGGEPGVELAAGDGDGRPRHLGQRSQRPPDWPTAEGDPEQGGDDARAEEREPEDPQGVVEIAEIEDLEVGAWTEGMGTPTAISGAPAGA